MWLNSKCVLCTVLLVQLVSSQNNYYNTDLGKCGKVHLTVSSLEGTYLELNWVTKCDHPDDIRPEEIALYDRNPLDRNEKYPPKVAISATKYPEGYYRTKVKFGHPWLPGNWEYHENLMRADPGQHCFPYWIVAFKGNTIIDSQCLRISPTWMSDNSEQLGTQRLGSLLIPGTHNSGSSPTVAFLQNYVMNQDRNVWTQLVFGIRYLDIRVGYYGNEGFFINHDVVRISKLIPVLREIKKFADMAPKEIIIVDIHRFPYPSTFNSGMHQRLLNILSEELGILAIHSAGIQSGRGPTLNEVWALNKSIIVCYAQKDIAKEYDWLWNPIQQFWGNKRNAEELKSYMDSSIRDHKTILNPMWALMAELTPQTLDVIFHTNDLRKLADNVNRQVTKWFRDDWLNNVNIVATDFFLGNDIINIAIDRNIHG